MNNVSTCTREWRSSPALTGPLKLSNTFKLPCCTCPYTYIEVTHRFVVRQVSQNKAAVLLLAREGFVVVAVVRLLVTQSEDLRQSVQLGSDVGLQEVLALSLPSLQTAVGPGLQELPEGWHNRWLWDKHNLTQHNMTESNHVLELHAPTSTWRPEDSDGFFPYYFWYVTFVVADPVQILQLWILIQFNSSPPNDFLRTRSKLICTIKYLDSYYLQSCAMNSAFASSSFLTQDACMSKMLCGNNTLCYPGHMERL